MLGGNDTFIENYRTGMNCTLPKKDILFRHIFYSSEQLNKNWVKLPCWERISSQYLFSAPTHLYPDGCFLIIIGVTSLAKLNTPKCEKYQFHIGKLSGKC